MIRCGYSVGCDNCRSWTETAASANGVCGLETSVPLLESATELVEAVELRDWEILNIRSVLPDNLAPYLGEQTEQVRQQFSVALARRLELGRCFAARHATLDLGLDRFKRNLKNDTEFDKRVDFIRKTLDLVSADSPSLCLRVRCPRRFPNSREWGHAISLVDEVARQNLGICLNVVSDDLLPMPAPEAVVGYFGERLKVIRLQLAFESKLGQRALETWAEALNSEEFSGAVILIDSAMRQVDPPLAQFKNFVESLGSGDEGPSE